MRETEGPPGPLRAWIMAARPRTLPASAAGVVVGSALAWMDGRFALLPALASLLVALAFQVASNLANDVFDFERGADAKRKVGPVRVTQAGLLSPGQVKRGLALVIAVACLAGSWLASVSSWWLLPFGAAAAVSAVAYTGGPRPLAYLGLGDLFVFLFFGLASVAGTYFVQAGSVSAAALLMSLPPGLLVVGILVVNNLRDVDEDREAGKRTLAVRFGAAFARAEYLACILVAYLAVPGAALAGLIPWWSLASWLSLPLAAGNLRLVLTAGGRPLNAALGGTGLTALAFSLLLAAGIGLDIVLSR